MLASANKIQKKSINYNINFSTSHLKLFKISFFIISIVFLTLSLLNPKGDRDWDQFHNGKDLALALSIEASELNEAFLWKSAEDVKIDKIKEELADIINYAFLIAYKYNLDIKDIVLTKLKRNAEKYPIDKAKGCAKKYSEL